MNRRIVSWIMIVLGGAAVAFGMFAPSLKKQYGGVIIGVGFMVFFAGIDYLVNKRYDQKHPVEAKQKRIEVEDERNQEIRNRAKAVSGDIAQWLVIAAAYCNMLADGELWITLLLVGIFTFKSVLDLALRGKYQKIM